VKGKLRFRERQSFALRYRNISTTICGASPFIATAFSRRSPFVSQRKKPLRNGTVFIFKKFILI
jgi:hypothetical protein